MAPCPLTPRTPRTPRQTTLSFPGTLGGVGKMSTDDIAGCHTVISAWTPLSPVTPPTIKLPIRTLQPRLQFRVTKAGVKRTPASKGKLAETALLTPPGSNSPAHSPLVSSPPTSPLPSPLEESTPGSAPGTASTPLSGPKKRTVDFDPLYRTSHGRYLLRREPFCPLHAQVLKAHRRQELKRILNNEPRFFMLLDNGATPFLSSTRPAKCNNQRLSLFASLPNEILVKIFSILLQRKIPDHTRRHFYRRDREQARRQYLHLHAGYFGNIPTSPNPGLDSVWSLMQTCHKLRNCVQYHVAGSTHIRVNILDLPAFVKDIVYSPTENLRQARFASIHVFVPAGLSPPIPIHPFLPLARAGMPVKLEFDKKQLYCNNCRQG
ncbi:hypothetical protein GGR51DRAFT_19056 [Nemania sp. FL0031]|nr:hypothetical protein GGR51DRAFT_19056 [Nemania sp. FL0031]